MQTPDVAELKTRLLSLLKRDALKKGKFVLSSGKESTFYLDEEVKVNRTVNYQVRNNENYHNTIDLKSVNSAVRRYLIRPIGVLP